MYGHSDCTDIETQYRYFFQNTFPNFVSIPLFLFQEVTRVRALLAELLSKCTQCANLTKVWPRKQRLPAQMVKICNMTKSNRKASEKYYYCSADTDQTESGIYQYILQYSWWKITTIHLHEAAKDVVRSRLG